MLTLTNLNIQIFYQNRSALLFSVKIRMKHCPLPTWLLHQAPLEEVLARRLVSVKEPLMVCQTFVLYCLSCIYGGGGERWGGGGEPLSLCVCVRS